MKVKISSPNLAKVAGSMITLITGIPIAAKQSSKIVANKILDLSLNGVPQAPEDEGDLRATGRVEPVKEGYAVVYGGKSPSGRNVDYAAYVHDDLRPRKYKRPNSGPKFVETHMLRMAEEAKPKIAEILETLASNIVKIWR